MTNPFPYPLEGGCDCGHIRYQLERAPLVVHCCHCRWCQRESGSAFALNAVIEASEVSLLQGIPEAIDTPSDSGNGQVFFRCPQCKLALWSNYSGAGTKLHFVRVGTLDEPDHLPPDLHIFTSSKQPWMILPTDMPAFSEYYNRNEVWSVESLARRKILMDSK